MISYDHTKACRNIFIIHFEANPHTQIEKKIPKKVLYLYLIKTFEKNNNNDKKKNKKQKTKNKKKKKQNLF